MVTQKIYSLGPAGGTSADTGTLKVLWGRIFIIMPVRRYVVAGVVFNNVEKVSSLSFREYRKNQTRGKRSMKSILRNALAVIVGIVVGGAVNMGLILLGGSLIPLPSGIDPMDPESLRASMPLFEARHFVFPFLAHALGTLVGAFAAALIAATHKWAFAVIVGGFFLAGGVANAFLLPAPHWFIALDLILAYLPMAWLGKQLADKLVNT